VANCLIPAAPARNRAAYIAPPRMVFTFLNASQSSMARDATTLTVSASNQANTTRAPI
jgi:hypothetical protein